MLISWFENGKVRNGAEYYCNHVARDMTKCNAYIRVEGNTYQAPENARHAGWRIDMGEAQCPEHLPTVTKDIRKGK